MPTERLNFLLLYPVLDTLSRYYCQKLREALDAVLDKVGPAFKHNIYEELERAGVSLEYPCSSLEEIEKALARAFSRDAALLLVREIRKELE